ncbi:MAG: anhydro-N-acetylmuramic acid kinase [Castellaniella sp.]|uniref:anhydro-N-acetylmuramic acid kinase n=1 Tax=Castellaniella sp. TaxID=1955812 RepID=UPI002A36D0F0|nr:anhydro-N-acetylmuramic acid kinase [Castellaniella sp.]MDY0308780.1 anhydro-N-acetylmuramic acid kinase [Castellaniella sp.]
MAPHRATEPYIGLMSGTSTDGVDGVLADLAGGSIRLLARASRALPDELRRELLALNTPGPDELARAANAANALTDCYADVVHDLLACAKLPASAVRAIGAHGQTVRHAPESGYTLQINAPARLAERTGIAVVADFRSRDVAAGGQGAPLVPAFHAACFGCGTGRAVLNLGGIANLTVLDDPVRGFDTGPANMLMDAWIQRHQGLAYDRDGAWAAQGSCHDALLTALLNEPWFAMSPPKSTGRDLFSLAWLDDRINRLPCSKPLPAVDVQATLLRLSVDTIASAVRQHAPGAQEILACGGGVRNPVFMNALARALPCRLSSTDACGVPAQDVEALAFAWLAQAHLQGHAACLPAVTGARHATIAGCLYPA